MKKMMPMMLLILLIVGTATYFAYQGFSMHQQVAIEEKTIHPSFYV